MACDGHVVSPLFFAGGDLGCLAVHGTVKDVAHSAVQYVRDSLGLKVCAVAQLSDLLGYLGTQSDNAMAQHLPAVQAYRDRYGVA